MPLAKSMFLMLVALTMLTSLFFSGACGKKAPPEPPSGNKPPPVRDLAYSITGNTIKLNWSVPQTTVRAKKEVAGFLIYQYQQSTAERECPSCPLIFRQVGDVPASGIEKDPLAPRSIIFTHTLEDGYRYVYKVKAYDNRGIGSRDSNLIEFTYYR
jgi:hypothetical protein